MRKALLLAAILVGLVWLAEKPEPGKAIAFCASDCISLCKTAYGAGVEQRACELTCGRYWGKPCMPSVAGPSLVCTFKFDDSSAEQQVCS